MFTGRISLSNQNVMLFRNIDPSNGLCNGTRMILLEIRSKVLKCHILGGDHAGKEVFIQRINIDPSEESLPFKLYRLQFPIHLAFVMTIKGNLLSMLCT